jgi:MFS superfamily sulfate permease-like transporter
MTAASAYFHWVDRGLRVVGAVPSGLPHLEPGKMVAPGVVMYWFGSDLFYANAVFFATQARTLVQDSPSPVRWLAIDASAITDIDYSAGQALAELQQDLTKAGVILVLVIVKVRHRGKLQRMGLLDLIASDHIFESRKACFEAYVTATSAENRQSATQH